MHWRLNERGEDEQRQAIAQKVWIYPSHVSKTWTSSVNQQPQTTHEIWVMFKRIKLNSENEGMTTDNLCLQRLATKSLLKEIMNSFWSEHKQKNRGGEFDWWFLPSKHWADEHQQQPLWLWVCLWSDFAPRHNSDGWMKSVRTKNKQINTKIINWKIGEPTWRTDENIQHACKQRRIGVNEMKSALADYKSISMRGWVSSREAPDEKRAFGMLPSVDKIRGRMSWGRDT